MSINEENPQEKYPRPPYPSQKQDFPGSEQKMEPQPDHGEKSYEGHRRLEGKKAIITGGDSGIGAAVAIAFAREGADILINFLDVQEQDDALRTSQHVTEAGQKAVLSQGDIRDESYCKSLIELAIDEFGKLDILVNNAAFQMAHKDITEISSEELHRTFETNFYGMFYLCQQAIPHLRPGSTIINTTSVNAYSPSSQLLPYAATKAAIQNFTSNLNQILLEADKGIRVNCVAPGPIWTPLIPSSNMDTENFGSNTPMGRAGPPAELAPIYVFLASKESSYVSGATVQATGGRITI